VRIANVVEIRSCELGSSSNWLGISPVLPHRRAHATAVVAAQLLGRAVLAAVPAEKALSPPLKAAAKAAAKGGFVQGVLSYASRFLGGG
jgi:hypothetical protein